MSSQAPIDPPAGFTPADVVFGALLTAAFWLPGAFLAAMVAVLPGFQPSWVLDDPWYLVQMHWIFAVMAAAVAIPLGALVAAALGWALRWHRSWALHLAVHGANGAVIGLAATITTSAVLGLEAWPSAESWSGFAVYAVASGLVAVAGWYGAVRLAQRNAARAAAAP